MLATLRTKLTMQPAGSNLVARPRLVARLAAGLTQPVTLITAPAGFGKTTLFSEWRAAAPAGPPVAWVSLDSADRAPARFWTYVVSALRTIPELAARPDFGAVTLACFECESSPPVDRYLVPLLNEIAACTAPFVLVLDDYHLAGSPDIDAAMKLVLDHLPENMRLVLVTRAEPGIPLANLRAQGRLCELKADDLRFTLSETAAYLNRAVAADLSDDEVDLLQRRTEGWVAGLQIAALSLKGRADRRAAVTSFAGDHRHIADYFAEEVLARQPQDVQAFLTQTAVLDRLCGPLCDAVTEGSDGQAMLERMEQANLFLVPLDDGRHWYRYHHLLIDLLRAKLQKTQPDLVRVLHSRASRWYEDAGLSLDAAAHAMRANDYARVTELSARNVLDWWADPTPAFVDRSNFLPPEVTTDRPQIVIVQGWGHVIQGQFTEASPLFDAAEQLIRRQPSDEAPALLSFLTLARKYVAEMTGRPYELTEADYLAPEAIPEASVAMRNGADTVLGFLAQMSGDFDRAAIHLLAAADRDLRLGSANSLPLAISRLARLRLTQGRLVDAEALLRKYIAATDNLGTKRFYVNGNLNAALADVLCERNDLGEALRQADEAVRSNDVWAIPHGIALAYQAKARVLLAAGDADDASTLVDRADRACLGRTLPADLVSDRAALRVDIWLARGDLAAAERWARDSGLTPADQPSFRREREHLTLARVLMATRRVNDAVLLLTGLVASTTTGKRNGRLIETLVLLAIAQAETSTSLAVATLRRALALAEPEGHIRTFVAPGEPVARLLRLIATVGHAVGKYAQRILNPNASASGAAEPSTSMPELLSGREFEVLRLLADGLSNRDIAAALTLTIGTVKTHVHSILGKLDATSRTQAIARARERGLIGN